MPSGIPLAHEALVANSWEVRQPICVICSHRAAWLMWVAHVCSHLRPTRVIRVWALNEGVATMYVEYLVLQANAEQGPFARMSAHKLNQSWDTLQEALDELGQHEWDLCTTIYSATKERSGLGEHYCEGFIFKRMSYAAGERTSAPESMRDARAF